MRKKDIVRTGFFFFIYFLIIFIYFENTDLLFCLIVINAVELIYLTNFINI